MRYRSLLLCSLAAVCTTSYAQLETPIPKDLVGARSLALSPDGDRLAFTYRGDVWVVPSQGGRAYPVTNNVEMDDNPVWSPDGKWLAFASNRTGNWDTFVVPADGGETRRLTWHSGGDVPSAWSPDGKYLLLDLTRDDPSNGLYLLDVKTTQLREVMRDMMSLNSPRFSADGTKIVYNRFSFPWTRPRYEGSGAAQIWVYDMASGKRSEIRNNSQQHLWPQFGADGKSIFAVTVTEKTPSSSSIDKSIGKITDNVNRTPNVYAIDMNGSGRRLTNFVGGSGARFLTVASEGGALAFEHEGKVYIRPANGEAKPISISAAIDPKTATEERLILTAGAQSASLSPKADKVAFAVNSEIWTVPVKKGKGPNADDATQITNYPGTDEQPLWAPDGKNLFFVSDRDGSERIYKMDTETKKVDSFGKEDYDQFGLEITPDKKSLTYWMAGPNGGLFIVPIEGGPAKRLINEPIGRSYAWSPDGRYLAYEKLLIGGGFNYWDSQTNIWVLDTQTGQNENVTMLNANHLSPEWSKDGRYLYFRSTRDGGGLFVIPVTQEDARQTELEIKYEKPTAPVKVEFSFDDPAGRIRKLSGQSAPRRFGPPNPAAPAAAPETINPSGRIASDPTNGEIYLISDGDIAKMSYDGTETRKLTSGGGIGDFAFSDDFNQLFFVKGGVINILNLRSPNPQASPVTFRADWTRYVRQEHEAAFREIWRAYNRGFYDPNFHGRDWLATRKRYEPLMDSVAHRNEMATVLNMMIGELESSHSEVGAAPGGPNGESSAHLGFTIDYSYAGPGLKIREVPARSPGSYAKTRLSPGEYVMAINGQDVRTDENLYRVLNEQANREVTLTVNSTPSKTGAREVKYRALTGGAWGALNYRNRIDQRRQYVEKMSNGQLTYLHIEGMGGGNYDTFNREAWQYAQGKKGVIIDVRNNGGGNISDQLLDILERQPQMQYRPRDGDIVTAPGTVLNKPTVVMMAETSFSNAEMFPAAMKARKLATIVGMPTPGYVIYTSGFRLVDGTSARMPGAGVYRLDGTPLENMGEQPDVKVGITPEEYFSGKDPQLDKAIEILMKQIK